MSNKIAGRKAAIRHQSDSGVIQMDASKGEFFPDALMREIVARFHHVGQDMDGRERLFFDLIYTR